MSDLPECICIWEADKSDPNSTRGWTVSFPESHPDIYVRASLNTRPAAPVEGLETKGYMRPEDRDQLSFWVSKNQNAYYREAVVTRSQSEDIIADLNAAIAVKDHGLRLLEADNAALTARVKELEDKRIEDRFTVVDEMEKREALETQLAALKDAAKSVEDWWLSEGMNHFPGAPYCIFAIRAALEAKP